MKIEKTVKIANADNSCTFDVKSVTVEGTDLCIKDALTLFYTLWEGKNVEVNVIEKNIEEKYKSGVI